MELAPLKNYIISDLSSMAKTFRLFHLHKMCDDFEASTSTHIDHTRHSSYDKRALFDADTNLALAQDFGDCTNSMKFSDFTFSVVYENGSFHGLTTADTNNKKAISGAPVPNTNNSLASTTIHAHKIFLYARCGYFRDLFKRNPHVRRLTIVVRTGSGSVDQADNAIASNNNGKEHIVVSSVAAFMMVLKWIYTDVVELKPLLLGEGLLANEIFMLARDFKAEGLLSQLGQLKKSNKIQLPAMLPPKQQKTQKLQGLSLSAPHQYEKKSQPSKAKEGKVEEKATGNLLPSWPRSDAPTAPPRHLQQHQQSPPPSGCYSDSIDVPRENNPFVLSTANASNLPAGPSPPPTAVAVPAFLVPQIHNPLNANEEEPSSPLHYSKSDSSTLSSSSSNSSKLKNKHRHKKHAKHKKNSSVSSSEDIQSSEEFLFLRNGVLTKLSEKGPKKSPSKSFSMSVLNLVSPTCLCYLLSLKSSPQSPCAI